MSSSELTGSHVYSPQQLSTMRRIPPPAPDRAGAGRLARQHLAKKKTKKTVWLYSKETHAGGRCCKRCQKGSLLSGLH